MQFDLLYFDMKRCVKSEMDIQYQGGDNKIGFA